MSVSDVGDRSKRKKRTASVGARRNAVKDAVPDRQSPGVTKLVNEDDEPVAENDEEDD
jgi:hypothetical protein